MNCPACGHTLTVKMVKEIEVDVCEGGCGGIWFDQFELQKLDDGDELGGEQLLDIARDPGVKVDLEAKRKCPRCQDVTMMRHFYGAKHQVTVDSCAGCAGYFLDAGELAAIRQQYTTESDREQHIAAAFREDVGGQLNELASQDAKKAEDTRRILRFFRVSHHLTGK